MYARRASGALAALLLLVTSACVDDPIPPDEAVPLTEKDAEILGVQVFRKALVDALAASPEGAANHTTGPITAPQDIFADTTTSAPCPAGGTLAIGITISGTVDEAAGTGTLDFTLVQTHQDCQFDENGSVYTLVGSPNVTLQMTLSVAPDTPVTITGSMTGGVAAAVDYRSSVCAVDVHFTGTSDPDGQATYTFTGTMCGEPISDTGDVAS